MKRKFKIGITDCGKYHNYEKWFTGTENNVEVIKLSYHANNADSIDECDGIVLSGGEDVHPKFYNKPEYLSLLNAKEINEDRDKFEWKVIEKSFALHKPVLGICRGMQVVNVFLGGTLIYDIPAAANRFEHGKINGADQRHAVSVVKDSLLYDITGKETGEINSAHHQSVNEAATELKVIADTACVAEGMQWKNADNKSWLLLVQWHPERMFDQQSPFAINIKKAFIKSCN